MDKIIRFFDLHPERLTSIKKGVLDINYWDVAKYNHELAESLLDNPEETIEKFKQIISSKLEKDTKDINIRFFSLPPSSIIKVADIRKEDLGKFLCFEGVVSRMTDVIVNTTSIKFECPACGQIIKVMQSGEKKVFANRCGCGRKGKLKYLSEELENIQKIMIEDFKIEREGNPKSVFKMVLLRGCLTDPKLSKKMQYGTHVQVIGILKTKELSMDSLEKDFYIEANNIIIKDHTLYSLELTEGDIDKVKAMSKEKDILDQLAESLSPGTEGLDLIKKALLIQHFRSDNIYDASNKLDERGTINILLVGSPGSNKSYLSRKSISFNPVSMFASGKGVSGVGLVGAVVHDKALDCWTLEPGAVPLCNKGIVLIDEADKIDEENLAYLNSAMSGLEVPFQKATVKALLETDTSFLCCANPMHREFVDELDKYRQLGLKPDFIDRFDLVFAIGENITEEDRKKIINKIIKRHMEQTKAKIDPLTITKYIAYAWQNIHPKISEDLYDYLSDNINKIMGLSSKKSKASFRIVSSVLRLSKAIARLYYSEKVRQKDVELAITLTMESFKSLGMVDQDNQVLISALQMTTPQQQVKAHVEILSILEKGDIMPFEDIRKQFPNLKDNEIEKILEMLKKAGQIFEPRIGFYSVIR